MPSVSQKTDVQGESCGACAASYVVEELLGGIFTKEQVEDLWRRVQFGSPVKPGVIGAEHSDPTKLLKVLERDYPDLKLAGCMAGDSPLRALTQYVAYPSVVQICEPMEKLIANPTWRLIGIYVTDGLHYVATRYKNGHFYLKDSNGLVPTYVAGPDVIRISVPFSAPLEGGRECYTYQGAGILVHL